ncbi:hypothetical protein Tco_0015384 [Tanacetum coccineum]
MSCGKTRKRFELVSPCHFSSNIEEEIYDFETMLERLYYRKVHRVHTLDFVGLTEDMDRDITERLQMYHKGMMVSFIAILGLHIVEEMETDGFRACWDASLRVIASKAELVSFTIAGRGQAPEKIYLGKHRAQMSRGHFIARLGMHFAVITKQSLRNLAVEVRELTTIDIKDVTSENFRIFKGDISYS